MTKTENYVTLPRLANRLGLQYYQVQYFVRTGRIPDGTLHRLERRWSTSTERNFCLVDRLINQDQPSQPGLVGRLYYRYSRSTQPTDQ